MPDNELTIVQTGDGSPSVSSQQYQALYHSRHGAIEEAMHIFISAGLYHYYRKGFKTLNIFEMGFGTGLNAFLSLITARKFELQLNYEAIELHPLEPKLYSAIDFSQYIPLAKQGDFINMHDSIWGETLNLDPFFRLRKIKGDITQFYPKISYDIIFFDAFAPSSQAHLWEKELHQKLFKSLTPGGSLLTYCAQGKFKRMLKELGYELDSLNGPGRKHEMTRAIKPIQ